VQSDLRLVRFRRRFLLAVLPLTTFTGVVDWILRDMAEASTGIAGLAGCLVPGVLALLLWRKPRSQRFVETASATWVVVCLLVVLHQALFPVQPGAGPDAVGSLVTVAPWLSASLIAMAIIFPPRRATWLACGIYLVALSMGLAYLLICGLGGVQPVLFRPLAHIFLANAVLLCFLSYAGHMGEQYLRTRHLALSLRTEAYTDPLLGIPNRRALILLMRERITLAEAGLNAGVLIMFDLDHFKEVNDTYGHDTGDRVLQAVARAVQQALRSTDRFGRWGGDEFLVLADVADVDQANALAQRLRDAVRDQLGFRFWRVTISQGVAAYQPGDTVESWVKRADTALYQAKVAGRNQVVIAT